MIHEIGRELQEVLTEIGAPLPIIDGPEPTKVTSWAGRERAVIERVPGEKDKFGPAISQHRNPKHRYTADVTYKITIYARSTTAGASVFEHQRRAIRLRDAVLYGLPRIAAARKNRWAPLTGEFIVPPDLAATERSNGAVYELRFSYEAPIEERTFAGASRPQGAMVFVEMMGMPDLTFALLDSTITRSAGSFETDGFAVGMTITVAGSASNNVTGDIATVTADTITLEATALVDEGPVSGCAIFAGGLNHITLVSRTKGLDDDGDPSTPPITSEIACGA